MQNIKLSIITSLYHGEKYLEGFFKSILNGQILDDTELILVHNDPLPGELELIDFYKNKIINFQHILVSREQLYKSWNRAIDVAKGEYLAMWSVDDVRTADGILSQVNVLDKYKNIGIVSGDYIKVFEYGQDTGVKKIDPVKKNKLNKVYSFNNGCFLMWRKSIHTKIGYFDEQFSVAGDWEFWMRATAYFNPGRADVMLGYYLRSANTGLSKTPFKNADIESYVVKARFYKYYLANVYRYFFATEDKIRVYEILNFGKWVKLEKQIPFNVLSNSISVLFFWVHSLINIAIEIKYKLLNKRFKSAPRKS